MLTKLKKQGFISFFLKRILKKLRWTTTTTTFTLGVTFGNCEPDCQPGKSAENTTDDIIEKTTEDITDEKHWSRSTSFIVTISVCFFLFILLIITFYYFHFKRRKEKGSVVAINSETIEEDPIVTLWDRKFPQSTVKAWKDITIERELGSGQFGKVYKGFLNSNYTR